MIYDIRILKKIYTKIFIRSRHNFSFVVLVSKNTQGSEPVENSSPCNLVQYR